MRVVADRQAFAVVVSIALSLTAGLVFFIAAWAGGYSWVGGLGGGGWVAFLTLIIALPTLMPWMRERMGRD